MSEKDLKEWVRVSSILQMLPSQDNEGKWGYPMQQINEVVLENARERGTIVHAAISGEFEEWMLTGKEEKYFDSYKKWATTAKIHSKEKRLFFEHMKLTGCIDMLIEGSLPGLLSIVDFKCTSASDPVKWPLQAAFYAFLAEMNGIPINKIALFVQLDSEGGYPKVHQYEITKELTQTALSLYNVYMYLTKS